MNKTVKTLLELNGMMLLTKAGISILPHAICGIFLPQYMVASISLGLVATGYYKFKAEKYKIKKDVVITERDLFELED